MIVTEAAAKEKRCCGPVGCGTVGSLTPAALGLPNFCIASACMAWAWCDIELSGPPEDRRGYCSLGDP